MSHENQSIGSKGKAALLKKPTWDPYETHVGTMWVPCGILVGPCGNHVGSMWDPCEKLLRDPIGNHVGPMCETDGNHVGLMWIPHDQSKTN